jgi:molybdopterin-binding protein
MDALEALVSIRPEKVHVTLAPLAVENAFVGRIDEEIFKGATDHLQLTTDAGARLAAVVANASALGETLHAGDRVYGAVHADDIVVLPSDALATVKDSGGEE